MAVARGVLTLRRRRGGAVVGPWEGLLVLAVVAAAVRPPPPAPAGWRSGPAPCWRRSPGCCSGCCWHAGGGSRRWWPTGWRWSSGPGWRRARATGPRRSMWAWRRRWSCWRCGSSAGSISCSGAQPQPEQALVAAGGVLGLFLLAYGGAWAYYRRGWFWWSVAPSGVAIVLTLGLTRGASPLALGAFLIGAAA